MFHKEKCIDKKRKIKYNFPTSDENARTHAVLPSGFKRLAIVVVVVLYVHM